MSLRLPLHRLAWPKHTKSWLSTVDLKSMLHPNRPTITTTKRALHPRSTPISSPNTGISIRRCRANAQKRPTVATTPYAFIPMVARSSHAIKTSIRIISRCNQVPNTSYLIGIKAPLPNPTSWLISIGIRAISWLRKTNGRHKKTWPTVSRPHGKRKRSPLRHPQVSKRLHWASTSSLFTKTPKREDTSLSTIYRW